MMKRLLFTLVMTGLLNTGFTSYGHASSDAGTDSALYLGAGAKAIAMGRAGLVETETAGAMLWNPANLTYSPALSVSMQHAVLFGDTTHETVAFNYPTMDWGGVGLAIQRMETGDIERRNAQNLPDGTFGYLEQQAVIGYGYPVFSFLSVGANVKLHYLRLDGLESMSPGVDAGLLFNYPLNLPIFKGVKIAANAQNALTPVLKLKNNADRLYTNWRFGTGIDLSFFPSLNDRFQLNVDIEKPERADMRLHTGIEYQVYDLVALRGGWDQEYFSAGIGVTYLGMALDYAVSFPDIGMRHLVTLSANIGETIASKRARREAEEEKKRQAIIEGLKNRIIEDYRRQAMDLTEKGDYAAAVPLWEKVLDWEPENKDVQERLRLAKEAVLRKLNSASLKLANEYYQDERYIDAMVECRTVLERDPDNPHAKKLYARSEKRAESLGKNALVTNVKLVKKIRNAYQQGLQAYAARDWSSAVKHWETVIENTPLQKQVYRYLRFARTRLADAKSAKLQKKGITQKQDKKRKLYKEAVTKAKSGDLRGAMKSWEKLVQENPDDKDAKKNLNETKKNLIDSQKKGIRW